MGRTRKWKRQPSEVQPVQAGGAEAAAAGGPAVAAPEAAIGCVLDGSSTARPAKRRRHEKGNKTAAAAMFTEPTVFEHDWDQLSAELRCHLLLFLAAGDVVKMGLMSSKWNAAVHTHLRTCTVLSFSNGPCGAVPRGLSDLMLYDLLGRCPRLRLIYGFHLSHRLQPEPDVGLDGGPCGSSTVVAEGSCRLTAAGVTRSLQQCPRLEGIEISDVLLLQAVPEALPKVQLLHGFRNRHGRLPLGKQSPALRLPTDVFTTSIELYAVTVPELPSLRHLKRLHLQYVILTEQQPFEKCSFPALESFAMKFCTALQLESRPDMLIDEFGVVHMELRGYKLLFEALARAQALQSIELVDVHFPHTGAAIWDVVTENGGFKNLRRFTIGNCPGAMTEDIGMLVISSSSRLEELQLQPRGCGEALLLALVASGCEFPALTRLHLGYSEHWHPAAAGTRVMREGYERSGRFLFVNQVNRFWDRTTQLTDHCLRRILASPMLPSLSALTICASPHLIDAQLWIMPVKTQLTELTLSCCLSLRRRELEKAIELMTQLRYLRLERVFRAPPKGCDHVDLTVQAKRTGISLLGPYAINVKWSGSPQLARQPESALEPVTYRLCRCGEHRAHATYVPAPSDGVAYRATQIHASTQVDAEEEYTSRTGSATAASRQQGRLDVAKTAGRVCLRCGCLLLVRSQGASGPSSGLPDAGAGCSGQAVHSGTAAATASTAGKAGGSRQRHLRWQRQEQQPPRGSADGGYDDRGCFGGNSASDWSDDDGLDSASDWSDDGSWGSSEWSEDGGWGSSDDGDDSADGTDDASSGSDAADDDSNHDANDDSNDDADGDTGGNVCNDDAGNHDGGHPLRPSKAVGTSDPLPEWDRRVLFFIRSPSLAALSLERVGVTAVALEDCSRLDSVSVSDCPLLTAFEFGPPCRYLPQERPPGWGPLSRITFFSCPKLWSGPVVHWSLVQPLPLLDRLQSSCGSALRMRVLTCNWDKPVRRVSDLVSCVEKSLPQMPDDFDSAFVVIEEHCHWSDTRRRMHVENMLSWLLTTATEVPDTDGVDRLSPLSLTDSERGNPWQRRRRRCGRVKVRAPKVASADGEDSSDQNTAGHIDGPVRVRFVHNLPSCLACGHRIDLWGAEYRHKRRTACTCQPRPVLASPLRVITCTYLYAASPLPEKPCELDDLDVKNHCYSQLF